MENDQVILVRKVVADKLATALSTAIDDLQKAENQFLQKRMYLNASRMAEKAHRAYEVLKEYETAERKRMKVEVYSDGEQGFGEGK